MGFVLSDLGPGNFTGRLIEALRCVLPANVGGRRIDPKTSLAELGLDSLSRQLLLAELERFHEVSLAAFDISGDISVADLELKLSAFLAANPSASTPRSPDAPKPEFTVHEEGTESRIEFNVMPGRRVTEILTPSHYEVGPDFARAYIKREYVSETIKTLETDFNLIGQGESLLSTQDILGPRPATSQGNDVLRKAHDQWTTLCTKISSPETPPCR